MSRVFTWAIAALVVFMVAFRPETASTVAKQIGSVLWSVAGGFGDFVAGLAG